VIELLTTDWSVPVWHAPAIDDGGRLAGDQPRRAADETRTGAADRQ